MYKKFIQICLILVTLILSACGKVSKLPDTDQIKLEYLKESEIHTLDSLFEVAQSNINNEYQIKFNESATENTYEVIAERDSLLLDLINNYYKSRLRIQSKTTRDYSSLYFEQLPIPIIKVYPNDSIFVENYNQHYIYIDSLNGFLRINP